MATLAMFLKASRSVQPLVRRFQGEAGAMGKRSSSVLEGMPHHVGRTMLSLLDILYIFAWQHFAGNSGILFGGCTRAG